MGRKTRGIIIVNLILLICILSILYFKYNKKQVIININNGAEPREFMAVLERSNLRFENQLRIFFVFKKRPTLASLEDIDKLYNKYKNIDFCAIFLNRFRLNQFFQFPHRFLARCKFVYLSSLESPKDSTCILLLKENKIIYVDNVLEIGRLAKILAWQVHSNSNIDDIKLSREDFRSILHDRIKNGNVSLVNIYTRDIHSLISIMLSGIEQIYVIHAACTSCELKKLLLNLIEMQRKNDILVIFSVRSNSYELVALLDSWNAHLSAYIDYFDALGLINTETSDEYSLISFNRREIL